MSVFNKVLDKFIDLYESGNGLSYGGTAGSFTQSSGLDSGGSGTGTSSSPIRFPGTQTQPDQAPPVNKIKMPRKEIEELPPSARALLQADNDGVIRNLINKLANKIPLTSQEQEIISLIKSFSKTPVKKPLDNDEEENEMKSTRTVMSDDVEMMNNPNRPRLSFSQT